MNSPEISKKRGRPLSPPPNDALKAPLPSDPLSLTGGPSPGISCIQLGINAWPDLLKLAVRMAKALAPLQTLGRRNVRGFPRPRLPKRLRQSSQGSMADPIPVVEQIKQGQPATLRCWVWDQASHLQLHGHEGKTSSRYRPWLPCFRRSISSC